MSNAPETRTCEYCDLRRFVAWLWYCASMKAGVDHELWRKVNIVLVESKADMGTALSTMIEGLVSLVKSTGVVSTNEEARVHMAAMLLSPNEGDVGSLLPMLEAELNKLRPN